MYEDENITTVSEEIEEIMPDGWYGEGDLFDEESWGDEPEQADESVQVSAEDSEEEMAVESETAPTPEQESFPGDTGEAKNEAPTPEPQQTAPNKLKFKARVDRQDLDVELDESELPTIYQKAQATDRAQARLAKQDARLNDAEALAKSLGYESLDKMLETVEQSYRTSEVDRLVGEGVHEEVAKDMVARRLPVRQPASTQASAPQAPARDFQGEVRELLNAHPELKGKSLPDEVVQACAKEGKPLFAAYAAYEVKQERAAAEKLRKENEILKQNAAAAAKAPVSGTRGGGATDIKGEDDFLRGFNDDY